MSEVLGVVIHVTAGTGDPYNEFDNSANQVSSHFGIGNGNGGMADGLIEQYVDTSTQSWAQAAGNASYLSVETEGEPTFGLTDAQVESFARIMAWANQTYGVPLVAVTTPGEKGLIWHGAGGDAWGGHFDCPGTIRRAQRAAILARAQQLLIPTPTDQEVANMECTDPETGGIWTVDPRDGHVEATPPAPFLGGLNGHPEWNALDIGTVAGIAARKDPSGAWGYDIAIQLPAAKSTGSWYDHYLFTRTGQYAK